MITCSTVIKAAGRKRKQKGWDDEFVRPQIDVTSTGLIPISSLVCLLILSDMGAARGLFQPQFSGSSIHPGMYSGRPELSFCCLFRCTSTSVHAALYIHTHIPTSSPYILYVRFQWWWWWRCSMQWLVDVFRSSRYLFHVFRTSFLYAFQAQDLLVRDMNDQSPFQTQSRNITRVPLQRIRSLSTCSDHCQDV